MKKNSSEMDEAFQSASIGDKLWLFFHKNVRKLTITFSAIGCCVLFFVLFTLFKSQHVQKIQKSYAAIITDDDRISFIKKYPSSMLAGMTALTVADKSFSQDDFQNAYNYYTSAYRALKNTILQHRAQIGQGLSLYQSQKPDEAKKILMAIVDDKTADTALRSCAAYYLAAILQSGNDEQSLVAFLQHVETLDFPNDAMSAIRLSAGTTLESTQENL